MKHTSFICDECAAKNERPRIILKGQWFSGKSGIMLPRIVYHFCSKECLTKWLSNADLHKTLYL